MLLVVLPCIVEVGPPQCRVACHAATVFHFRYFRRSVDTWSERGDRDTRDRYSHQEFFQETLSLEFPRVPGPNQILMSAPILVLRYHTMFPTFRRLKRGSVSGLAAGVVSILAAGALGISTTGAYAQDFTLSVDVPVVSLDVSVTDENGQPVDGLRAEDFEILENGERQQVRYFGSSTAPYHVYLLFDSSGSTRHKWDFMRRAAAGFVEFIKPQDRVSVGIFDARLKTLTDWDDSREDTLAALNPITNGWRSAGTTEFYRSLERAIERSFDRIRERRAIIVLTDGRDTSLYREIIRHNRVMRPEEDKRFKGLYQAAAEGGIPVYLIAVNTDLNLDGNTEGADEHRNLKIIYGESPVPKQYLEQVRIRMGRVAEISGGQILYPKTLDDVVPLFEQIGQTLGHSYSIGYVPEIEGPDTVLRRIVVKTGNDAHSVRQSRAGYYVTAPQ